MGEEQAEYGEDILQEVTKDIMAVCKRQGLKNCSFCGFDSEGHFVGIVSADSEETELSTLFSTVLAIGRLWQHARGTIKKALDGFERGW